MNFYCVKVGTRYSDEFVVKLESMISRCYDRHYKLYCITDDPKSLPRYIRTIKMPDYRLEKWWAKMVLFDESFIESGIFFDLDILVKGDINKLYNPGKYMKFMHTDWVDLDKLHNDTIGNRQRYCSINSSVLMWNKETKRQHIFEYFMNNKEKITSIFTGIDSFIEHRFPKDYMLYDTPLDQIHLFLEKKQDELREEKWIQKIWA